MREASWHGFSRGWLERKFSLILHSPGKFLTVKANFSQVICSTKYGIVEQKPGGTVHSECFKVCWPETCIVIPDLEVFQLKSCAQESVPNSYPHRSLYFSWDDYKSHLRKQRLPLVMTSEPGGGRLGDAIGYLMPFLLQYNQFLGKSLAVSIFKTELSVWPSALKSFQDETKVCLLCHLWVLCSPINDPTAKILQGKEVYFTQEIPPMAGSQKEPCPNTPRLCSGRMCSFALLHWFMSESERPKATQAAETCTRTGAVLLV